MRILVDKRFLNNIVRHLIFLNGELITSNEGHGLKWFFPKTGRLVRNLKSKMKGDLTSNER